MNKPVCILIILILIYLFYKRNSITESFYIKQIYNPSYLERNPLVCYVSEPEGYLDKYYFQNVIGKKFPIRITTNKSDMFSADLALLPENIILEKKQNNSYPYDYLSHIKDVSFYLVELANSETEYNSISEMKGKTIYLCKNGYTDILWKKLINFLNLRENNIKIVYYSDPEIAKNALKNKEADAIAMLTSHPNDYIFNMSYEMKLHFVPLKIDDNLVDIAQYTMKGLKKTKISCKQYRYPYLKQNYESFGFSHSLFIGKNLPNDIVEDITKYVFQPKEGITRSAAVGGSYYIPFSVGTRSWLEKQGYISISDGTEDPGCTLLAGKNVCDGDAGEYAKHVYNKDFWGSTVPNDPTVVSYLKETNKRAEPEFKAKDTCKYDNDDSGKYQCEYKRVCPENYVSRSIFRRVIDDSYLCFEDISIKPEANCTRDGKTWDKPCLSNEECPFYKANQNYPNEFGKCLDDGFCQMPLGVTRKAYRKYESTPICHNCPPDNPRCCKKTEIMASADFAFKNDRMERLKNSKELELRGIIV